MYTGAHPRAPVFSFSGVSVLPLPSLLIFTQITLQTAAERTWNYRPATRLLIPKTDGTPIGKHGAIFAQLPTTGNPLPL